MSLYAYCHDLLQPKLLVTLLFHFCLLQDQAKKLYKQVKHKKPDKKKPMRFFSRKDTPEGHYERVLQELEHNIRLGQAEAASPGKVCLRRFSTWLCLAFFGFSIKIMMLALNGYIYRTCELDSSFSLFACFLSSVGSSSCFCIIQVSIWCCNGTPHATINQPYLLAHRTSTRTSWRPLAFLLCIIYAEMAC